MFFLAPEFKTVSGIELTLELFFIKEKSRCRKKVPMYCPVHWWYNTCIGERKYGIFDQKVPCPFFQKIVDIHCDSNLLSWNLTKESFFEFCKGGDLIFGAAFMNYIHRIILPFLICFLLTSVFKISVFNEVAKDFNWRVVIWICLASSVRYLIQLIIVFTNSSSLISSLCISLTIVPLTLDFFITTCYIVLHMYAYIVMNYFEIQLRIIKAALSRVTIMVPFIGAIVCLVLDLRKDNRYNFFDCETDIFNSNLFYPYFILYFIAVAIIIVLRIFIQLGIRRLLQDDLTGVFRLEYDIVGERKQIPKREILRLRYTLDCIVITLLLRSIHYISIILIYTWLNIGLKIYVYFVSLTPLLDGIFPLIVVWMNRGLQMRICYLKELYEEINDQQYMTQNEEDFNTVLERKMGE